MAHNFSLEHPISKLDATFSSSIRGLIADVLCHIHVAFIFVKNWPNKYF